MFSPSNEYNALLNYCMNDDSTRVITGTVDNVESYYDEMMARYDSMANAGVYDYADLQNVPSFTVIAVEHLLDWLRMIPMDALTASFSVAPPVSR